jgi:hypothetical protein
MAARASVVASRRVLTAVLAGVVSWGLVFSAAPDVVPEAAAAPTDPAPARPASPTAEWVEPTGRGLVRPDLTSASVTARASGQRVEVLSQRSEAERTWVLPSGELESELTGGPVRFARLGRMVSSCGVTSTPR